jgi:hypothetical protein
MRVLPTPPTTQRQSCGCLGRLKYGTRGGRFGFGPGGPMGSQVSSAPLVTGDDATRIRS